MTDSGANPIPIAFPGSASRTAWRISMGRRQVVESVNAALKGAFTDLARGFIRVMGLTKMTVMLGFTLAAYNLDRILKGRGFMNSEVPIASNQRMAGP